MMLIFPDSDQHTLALLIMKSPGLSRRALP